jgi:hypothetical protein
MTFHAPNTWLVIVSILLALIGVVVENLTILPAIPRTTAFWFAFVAWFVLFLATFVFPKADRI